ncbi:hypothetical protein METSMIALI_00222 [Methanobrevibacter smithii DSM 2375]|uniref:Uncharacterized protein n=1 Tax=Methanobrevibacter smithii DSM 2375 TaxID=483214 RepID=B9AD00_METSM|nr:hypothetical protein METSMIALI_00222 [Methanobrevibacter smithii DSM 2375]
MRDVDFGVCLLLFFFYFFIFRFCLWCWGRLYLERYLGVTVL